MAEPTFNPEQAAVIARAVMARRKAEDPLTYYKAHATGQRFHASDAHYRLIAGPNRCLAPWQEVYDPIAGKMRRVDSVTGPWHVLAWDGRGIVVAEAERPFIKEPDDYLSIIFDDGSQITCSPQHRIMTASGEWWQASTLLLVLCPERLPKDIYELCLAASDGGDPAWRGINKAAVGACRVYGHLHPQRQRVAQASGEHPLDIASVSIAGGGDVWDFTVPVHHNYVAGNCINHNSGKSATATVELAMLLRGIHPTRKPYKAPLLILQFVTSRRQAKYVIGKKLIEDSELRFDVGCPAAQKGLLPAHEIEKIGYKPEAGEQIPYSITMKNGNVLMFAWSGVEEAFKRIAGLKLDGVFVDEDSGTQRLFDEIYPRLLDAQSDPERKWGGFIVWSATNTSYNEAYSNFLERCERNIWGHEAFIIKPEDNTAISMEARERMKGAMSEEAAAIRLDGSMSAADIVSIYGRWWDDNMHLSQEAEDPSDDDCIFLGYDPGVDHETGLILAKATREFPNRLTTFWCWCGRGGTVRDDAERLARVLRGRTIGCAVYDRNLANRNRGGGQTPLDLFRDALVAYKLPVCMWKASDKRHDTGIARVRQMLRPGYQAATVGNGLKGIQDAEIVPPLLLFAKPTDENGVGRLRHQFLQYRGRERTKFKGAGGVVKMDDDLLDAHRYLCTANICWTPTWRCGPMLTGETQTQVILPRAGVPIGHQIQPKDAFEAHLLLSKQRRQRKTGGWRESFI